MMQNKKIFNKTNINIVLFLFIIVVLGGILRFSKLEYQSLWNDELASMNRINQNSLKEVIDATKKDVHPPLYYLLLFLWQKLYGSSIFSVRFLSAIFGVLSILAIFFLGKALYSDLEGLLSALILSISYFGIYYSQEVRGYSLLLLLSISSYFFFVKIQPQQEKPTNIRNKISYYIFYVIFTTMLIYTHYFGILILFSQFVFIALDFWGKRYKGILKPLLSQFCIILLYTPQIPIMKSKMKITDIWIKKPHFDFFIHYFNEYWGKNEVFFIISLFCIFCFFYFRKNSEKEYLKSNFNKSLLIIVWCIVPLIIAYARSIFSTPILISRSTIIILPPLILMMAKGIASLKNKDLIIALTAAIFITGLYSIFIDNDYYNRITKEQFREAANVVLENKKITDQSIIIACAWNLYYFDYFFKQAGTSLKVSGKYLKKEDIPELNTLLERSQKKYLWYLIGHRYPSQEFLQYLNNNYVLLTKKQFKGSSFFLFQLR